MKINNENYNKYINPISPARIDIKYLKNTYKHKQSDIYDELKIQKSEKYYNAKKYLDKKKNSFKFKYIIEKMKFEDLNLNKLDGIQEGIEVFKGLSIKEISFIYKNLSLMPLSRGCRNNCTHCMFDAKIPINNDPNIISTIKWEDLLRITKGFKELNKRLGFTDYTTKLYPFMDSEPMNLKSFDNKGKAHNIAEAIKIIHDDMGMSNRIHITTAGWHKKDEWSKQAAIEIVEMFKENPNIINFLNVSINPFHKIMDNSIQLKNKGELQKSLKLRNIYVERMAETIYIFLPIFAQNKATTFIKGARSNKKNIGYDKSEAFGLGLEIFNKFNQICEQRGIQGLNEKEIQIAKKNIFNIDKKINNISGIGRAVKYEDGEKIIEETEKYLDSLKVKNNKNKLKKVERVCRYVDINGKVYCGSETNQKFFIINTDLQLNLENRDKNTPKIFPDNCDVNITKDEINKIY